ncbi:interleukin-34 isoform X1 [Gadus macrocephalus]|uniref:interleukin-34 isoform X1 n=1 Tax=Gadus macrocephalus TaxID=80720 RepID=UPI0028CB3E68|nr:interleukin-34 isoform X1 [Gadus macrocephalus]XP_059917013.1 interleukin-34 isoform X1 [Gadus macrocephalus]
MVQLSVLTCLFGGLLGLLLLVPVLLAPTPPGMCTALRTINSNLSQRRKYMQHNFPINYTIRVHYEEVFKPSNISRLKLKINNLEMFALQRLWFHVNHGILKKILRVIPERHPSRRYGAELERRFRDAEGLFVQSHPSEAFQRELPEKVQEKLDRMTEHLDSVPASSWRFVPPKHLLDNFRRSMRCLFGECFSQVNPQVDLCGNSRSKKDGKVTQRQPQPPR